MSNLEVWLIIILVIGVIASNLAVLKYSAKFKMPQFGKHQDKAKPNTEAHGDNPPRADEDGGEQTPKQK